MPLDFDQPDLARAIELLPVQEIDALPFGAIHVDAVGRIVFYSKREAELSGYGSRPAVGKLFFREVAPCMGVEGFEGRIQRARAHGHLDLQFGWIGDFSDQNRKLKIRAQSAPDGGMWIFIRRDVS
jgi:photoactive yellow protein